MGVVDFVDQYCGTYLVDHMPPEGFGDVSSTVACSWC